MNDLSAGFELGSGEYLSNAIQVRLDKSREDTYRADQSRLLGAKEGKQTVQGSLITICWSAFTSARCCLVPLGHSMSIAVTDSFFPSPKVSARSLAEQ